LFLRPAFHGFGPTNLDPARYLPWRRIQGHRTALLKKGVRESCPQRPGVYGMIGVDGELIYVGKAKRLRARLMSYFRPRSRLPKASEILQRTRAIAWEFAANEFAALLRELELIHRWRPELNVQGQPRRWRRVFVCVGRQPAPYVFLSRRRQAGLLGCFGPVPHTRRAGEAVRWLNDYFQLRDCPQWQTMHFAEQGELFPVARTAACLRYEIRTCLGPCAGVCSRRSYLDQARAALAFLAGNDRTPIAKLEQDMTAAAAAMKFEQAANLRDKVDALRWLNQQLERLRTAQRQLSLVYGVKGLESRTLWYLIDCGRVAGTIPLPPDARSRLRAQKLLEMVFRKKETKFSPLPIDVVDQVLLVATWFRKHPEERSRSLTPAAAMDFCRGSRPA
jgi:excinuclease ABC subunit C